MRKKKIFLTSLASSLLFSTFLSFKNVNANESSTTINYDQLETTTEIAARINSSSNYGKVIFKEPIKLGKYDIELYVEFENLNLALSNFVKNNFEVISYIKNQFLLDDITIDNFENYYKCFIELLNDANNPYFENHEVISEFKKFYDIFENSEENGKILNMVNEIKINTNSLVSHNIEQNDQVAELVSILPYYNELCIESNERMIDSKVSTMSTRSLTGTALSNAKAYAFQYYNNPNIYNYPYFENNDCANFASQILEASGRNQVNGSTVYSGWWHRITYPYETFYPEYNQGAAVHEQSRSWTLADGFADFFGIYDTYTTIKSLSKAVRVGDFIVEDDYGDGEYDHVGFVTAKDTSESNYTNEQGTVQTYINFEVTQHSANYRNWVSSTRNGWEYFNRGERVAIVRV